MTPAENGRHGKEQKRMKTQKEGLREESGKAFGVGSVMDQAAGGMGAQGAHRGTAVHGHTVKGLFRDLIIRPIDDLPVGAHGLQRFLQYMREPFGRVGEAVQIGSRVVAGEQLHRAAVF